MRRRTYTSHWYCWPLGESGALKIDSDAVFIKVHYGFKLISNIVHDIFF